MKREISFYQPFFASHTMWDVVIIVSAAIGHLFQVRFSIAFIIFWRGLDTYIPLKLDTKGAPKYYFQPSHSLDWCNIHMTPDINCKIFFSTHWSSYIWLFMTGFVIHFNIQPSCYFCKCEKGIFEAAKSRFYEGTSDWRSLSSL